MKLVTGELMCDVDGCSSTNQDCSITIYPNGTHLCEHHTYLQSHETLKLVVYMDGLCEPRNPGGVACYGWTFAERKGYGVVENNSTNNIAEYNALISVMRYLIREGITGPVEFRGDSALVINQMSGRWKIKKPHIQELVNQARGLARKFDSVSFTWVPREQNELADELSRKAYSAYRRKELKAHEETVIL